MTVKTYINRQCIKEKFIAFCCIFQTVFLKNCSIKPVRREAAKMSALSSCKIHKYEYLTDKEILPSSWSKVKFTYWCC